MRVEANRRIIQILQLHRGFDRTGPCVGEGAAPERRHLNSYFVVSYGVAVAMKGKRLDDAWIWAQRGLSDSGNFSLAGESEFLVGEVAFARSDYDTASKYFKAANKMSGWKLFQTKNPRYRRLLEVL